MKMQLLVFFIVMASAEVLSMKLEGNKAKNTADIMSDLGTNTHQFDAPNHRNKAQGRFLKDFSMGLAAVKDPAAKECYIAALQSPDETVHDLKKSMGMFYSRYSGEEQTDEEKRPLFIRKMTNIEVGKKIAAFCAGYELILATIPVSMNSYLQKQGKRKRGIISSFWGCNIDSNYVPILCRRKSGTLATRCRFWKDQSKDCTYEITCNAVTTNGKSGADCPGVNDFRFMECCDFICL
ncbi:uncharacterized protein LOC135695513 isoform X2 [Rhopilema esculentum]